MIFKIFLCSLLLANGLYAGGKSITYEIDGSKYEAYINSPKADAPLILLVHDWDGLTDYEIKRADMLAELGYAVFALDLYGKGIRPIEIKDKKAKSGELYNDRKKMRKLLNGAYDYAKKEGLNLDNAIIAGYCFGGSCALELARSGKNLKGFVSFHGGLQTPEGQDYSKTKGSLLILHGTADKVATIDQFAALAIELEKAGITHEMITYSGAPHAFTVFGSERYREDADKKSWRRFTEFLHEILQAE